MLPGRGLSKSKPPCQKADLETLYGSCSLRIMDGAAVPILLSCFALGEARLPGAKMKTKMSFRLAEKAFAACKTNLIAVCAHCSDAKTIRYPYLWDNEIQLASVSILSQLRHPHSRLRRQTKSTFGACYPGYVTLKRRPCYEKLLRDLKDSWIC